MVMLYPLACSNLPTEEEIIPLPNDEATPPVTNMYLVAPTMYIFYVYKYFNFSCLVFIKLQNYKISA